MNPRDSETRAADTGQGKGGGKFIKKNRVRQRTGVTFQDMPQAFVASHAGQETRVLPSSPVARTPAESSSEIGEKGVHHTMVTRLNRARKNRRAAFTLIELLVVVLILGILLAVAIPLYLSSVKNSATRTVQGNLRTIGQAAQAYKVKNNRYPGTIADLVGTDKDLQNTPSGPRGVSYTLTGSTVTATEAAEDVFGTAGGSGTATFDVSTGAFSGLE